MGKVKNRGFADKLNLARILIDAVIYWPRSSPSVTLVFVIFMHRKFWINDLEMAT